MGSNHPGRRMVTTRPLLWTKQDQRTANEQREGGDVGSRVEQGKQSRGKVRRPARPPASRQGEAVITLLLHVSLAHPEV